MAVVAWLGMWLCVTVAVWTVVNGSAAGGSIMSAATRSRGSKGTLLTEGEECEDVSKIASKVQILSYRGGSTTAAKGGAASTEGSTLIQYLQKEQIACSQAQQNLIQVLKQRYIPLGQEARSLLRQQHDSDHDNIQDRIIESRADNHVECRISLDRVPIGSKCIAPCQCTGSSKYVQFSVLNKLRRQDPKQWIICPTCRTPFQYERFMAYGNSQSAMIGYVLDHARVLRSVLLTSVLMVSYVLDLPSWLSRFVVSSTFWMQVSSSSTNCNLMMAEMKLIVSYLQCV